MAVLMIRCPETGRGIKTQYEMEQERFGSTPVFFARSYCPLCRTEHEWFARDAWLFEQRPYSNRCDPVEVRRSGGGGSVA
jgi:hypothetical protein